MLVRLKKGEIFYLICLTLISLGVYIGAWVWTPLRGLEGKYYANSDWKGNPQFVSLDSEISTNLLKGHRGHFSENRFSVKWNGFLVIERSGEYTFATASDDGSDLFIKDQQIVDNGGPHGLKTVQGQIYLETGIYPVQLRYFQAGGSYRMDLLWSQRDQNLTTLPSYVLSPGSITFEAYTWGRRLDHVLLFLKWIWLGTLIYFLVFYLFTWYSARMKLSTRPPGSYLLLSFQSIAKRTLQNALVMIGSILMGLLLLEVGLRFFIQQSPHERPPTSFWEPHSSLGWFHIPGKEGLWANQEFSNTIRINSSGFRDREYSLEKPAGIFRIVVLGDSMTEGFQVPLEQTFTKVLETLLNERVSSDTSLVDTTFSVMKFEVLNLGVAAYGTSQEYLLLKEYGFRYQPDLVVLAFLTLNDVLNNSLNLEKSMAGTEWERTYRPYFVPDGNGDLKQIFPRAIHLPFWESLYTYRFLLDKIRTIPRLRKIFLPRHTDMDFWGLYRPDIPPAWREAWNITQKLILKIESETDIAKSEFLLISLTNRDSYIDGSFLDQLRKYAPINWDIDKPDKILADFCQTNAIPFLALTPLYRDHLKKVGQPIKFHYQGDGHWNTEGHKLAAEFIYKKLKEMGIIEKSLDKFEQ
jgi:hypothetical protein